MHAYVHACYITYVTCLPLEEGLLVQGRAVLRLETRELVHYLLQMRLRLAQLDARLEHIRPATISK